MAQTIDMHSFNVSLPSGNTLKLIATIVIGFIVLNLTVLNIPLK